ncbi:MAG: DUF928 domain-containing protein [Chroococcus sp. CMT-3BRIN-NPC107]|nr:DUF928 domain-containing protein [Chroococcus sp. CMT-3BRIN-NPC107]
MENVNQVRAFTKRALGSIILVFINTSYINPVEAQNIAPVNQFFERSTKRSLRQLPGTTTAKPQKRSGKLNFIQPKLPSSGVPSGRQRGAAGRGSCLHNVNIPLTAIVPSIKISHSNGDSAIVATSVWGLTVKERPTFLFYIPYAQSAAGEFVLQDSEDNDIYRAPVNLPKEPGIIRLQLPPESAPLAIDKMYHWYFKVRCSQNMASPVFVEGWVQRIALNLTIANQINTATSLQQQVALYAENGIWYDTAAILAQMRVQNLEDAMSKVDWQNLLSTIDLSLLASESIKRIDNKDEKSLMSNYELQKATRLLF